MVFREKLAGHIFSDTHRIDSVCISNVSEGVPCTATRATIFTVTQKDYEEHVKGFAHVSSLTQAEYEDIVRERKAYADHCDRLMDALRQVSG